MSQTEPLRAAFEAWYAPKFASDCVANMPWNKRVQEYFVGQHQVAWLAWQAALAQQTAEETCERCGGAGHIEVPEGRGPDVCFMPADCPSCSGTGAAPPPARKPLRGEQIVALAYACIPAGTADLKYAPTWLVPFARAIEAAHGIEKLAPAAPERG